MKLFRWAVVKLFGAPVCVQCDVYNINCIGRCGMTASERIQVYIERG